MAIRGFLTRNGKHNVLEKDKNHLHSTTALHINNTGVKDVDLSDNKTTTHIFQRNLVSFARLYRGVSMHSMSEKYSQNGSSEKELNDDILFRVEVTDSGAGMSKVSNHIYYY